MEISSQEARYQRLIKTRNTYSSAARLKAERFRQEMESSREKRLFERQKHEMEEIEAELGQVRNQYQRICQERGSAHLTAQLIRKQEKEILEFESRRDKLVKDRAQKVAREKEKENKAKKISNEVNKKELIERRKEIFNRDWNEKKSTESTSVKQIDDRSQKRADIELQLKRLVEMEKSLEEKIKNKKAQHRPVQNQDNYNSSSDSESEEVTDPHFVGRYVRSRERRPKHCHHHENIHLSNPPQRNSGCLETDPMTDPDVIAKNVLLKLERMKDQMRKTLDAVVSSKGTQVYKDTAVNITKPKEIYSQDPPVVREEISSGASSASSYKSLPKTVQPKKREFAQLIQKLKNQCFLENRVKGGDVTASEDTSDDFGERVYSLIESSGIERSISHKDRHKFWDEVCQEAGTILHEETAAALANMTDGSSKAVTGIEEIDIASDCISPVAENCNAEYSTQDKLSSLSRSSANTIKGLLEERSLTFASSFSSDEE